MWALGKTLQVDHLILSFQQPKGVHTIISIIQIKTVGSERVYNLAAVTQPAGGRVRTQTLVTLTLELIFITRVWCGTLILPDQ